MFFWISKHDGDSNCATYSSLILYTSALVGLWFLNEYVAYILLIIDVIFYQISFIHADQLKINAAKVLTNIIPVSVNNGNV